MDKRIPIFRSLAVIEERIREKLTVENLAREAHFSKFHYQRLFRETVGESVMRYVTRRRLMLAAEELASTEASVLEIALKYGYDSHEGFTRSFRTYMGAAPAEYRKYCLGGCSSKIQKEEYKMNYSKTTGEIIRELNSLTVQARETADYVRKSSREPFYAQFWDFCAARAESMADALAGVLEQIDSIARQPDEITSRLMIIKAIEDTVFWSHVTAFQIRLTVARAQPGHRERYEPLCEKFDALSRNADIRAEKILSFFAELSSLIFQDIRNTAKEKIQDAAARGKNAAKALCEDPGLPYSYIGEEVSAIVQELEAAALDEITVSGLEDYLFRLDIILLAAETDALRAPCHRVLFQGIGDFKGKVEEVLAFFRNLPEDAVSRPGEASGDKSCSDTAFQGNILLFYLKGEVQKLGGLELEEDQKAALRAACRKMEEAVGLLHYGGEKCDPARAQELLGQVCYELERQAEKLEACGGPIQFISDEIRRMAEHCA